MWSEMGSGSWTCLWLLCSSLPHKVPAHSPCRPSQHWKLFSLTHILLRVFAGPCLRCWDQRSCLSMLSFYFSWKFWFSSSIPLQAYIPGRKQQDRLTSSFSFYCLLTLWVQARKFLLKFLCKFLAIPTATCLGKVYQLIVWFIYGALHKNCSSEGCGMKCQKPWVSAVEYCWTGGTGVLGCWLSHQNEESPGQTKLCSQSGSIFFPF